MERAALTQSEYSFVRPNSGLPGRFPLLKCLLAPFCAHLCSLLFIDQRTYHGDGFGRLVLELSIFG